MGHVGLSVTVKAFGVRTIDPRTFDPDFLPVSIHSSSLNFLSLRGIDLSIQAILVDNHNLRTDAVSATRADNQFWKFAIRRGTGQDRRRFPLGPIPAEVIVDKLKRGLSAVLVQLFKTGVFVEDFADSPKELSQGETECAVVVEVINDISDDFERTR